MLETVLDVVSTGMLGPLIAYWVTFAIYPRGGPGPLGWVRRWTFRLRWIILGVQLGSLFALNVVQGEPTWVITLLALGQWIGMKGDDYDDDFWKRQKQKAKDAVAVAGHRLVVAPAQAPS